MLFLFEKEGELLFNFAIKRLVKSGPTTSSSETLEQRSYEFSILESGKEKKKSADRQKEKRVFPHTEFSGHKHTRMNEIARRLIPSVEERLTISMDILTLADQREDYHLAAACFDVIIWMLREYQNEPEELYYSQGAIPFTYNLWRTYTRDLKCITTAGIRTHLNRAARDVILNGWIDYRLMTEKRKKKKTKGGEAATLVYKLASQGIKERNRRAASDEEEYGSIAMSMKTVVTRKLPASWEKYDREESEEEEKTKLTTVAKEILAESKRILQMVQTEACSQHECDFSIFQKPYERWVNSIFGLCCQEHPTLKRFGMLNTSIKSYESLQAHLKNYNVFRPVLEQRPEGTYPKVKYLPYYQESFKKWLLLQNLTSAFKNTHWNVSVKKPYHLNLVLMQLFCQIVLETTYFANGLRLLESFWASSDKIGFIKSLNENQANVIDQFNKTTLLFYKQPVANVVESREDDGEEEDEENDESERKNLEQLHSDYFEERERGVKERGCGQFRRKFTTENSRECEEEFKMMMDKIVENTDQRLPVERAFSNLRVDDLETGVQGILEHYLIPEETATETQSKRNIQSYSSK